MDFPAVPPVPYVYEDYMGAGLGAVPTEVLRTERDLMLVYESDEIIRTMKPDFSKLKEFPIGLSVYVTARSSDPAYDIAARAFWPKLNIDEDPVCGSMHTTLVPYWSSCRGLREEDSGCGWVTLAADTGDGGREGYPEKGLV